MDSLLINICNKVAREVGIPEKDAQRIYSSYFRHIHELLSSWIPGEDDSVGRNFNLTGLGKIYVNEWRIKRLLKIKGQDYVKDKENETNV